LTRGKNPRNDIGIKSPYEPAQILFAHLSILLLQYFPKLADQQQAGYVYRPLHTDDGRAYTSNADGLGSGNKLFSRPAVHFLMTQPRSERTRPVIAFEANRKNRTAYKRRHMKKTAAKQLRRKWLSPQTSMATVLRLKQQSAETFLTFSVIKHSRTRMY
jgi:hypothetical protein